MCTIHLSGKRDPDKDTGKQMNEVQLCLLLFLTTGFVVDIFMKQ